MFAEAISLLQNAGESQRGPVNAVAAPGKTYQLGPWCLYLNCTLALFSPSQGRICFISDSVYLTGAEQEDVVDLRCEHIVSKETLSMA